MTASLISLYERKYLMSRDETPHKIGIREMEGPVTFLIYIMALTDQQSEELIKLFRKIHGVERARRLEVPIRGPHTFELTMKSHYADVTSTARTRASIIAYDFQVGI